VHLTTPATHTYKRSAVLSLSQQEQHKNNITCLMQSNSALAVALMAVLCLTSGVLAYDVVVNTIYGDIGGVATDVGYEFTSVPFAQPPVGSLRLRPPQELEPWEVPRGAFNLMVIV
jgi:hypothetical protein